MKTERKTLGISMVVGALLATALTSGATAANAATPEAAVVPEQSVAGVTVEGAPQLADRAALDDWLVTTPTETVVSVSTGDLLSARSLEGVITPLISERNVCQAGDAYWRASAVPIANACFYGSAGTATGSYVSKDAFFMGNYTARGGWIYAGIQLWTPKQGPGSVSYLDGVTNTNKGQIY